MNNKKHAHSLKKMHHDENLRFVGEESFDKKIAHSNHSQRKFTSFSLYLSNHKSSGNNFARE